MFHAALGDAVGCFPGQRLFRMLWNYDLADSKERRGAHDGAEVVGIGNAVEQQQRRAHLRPGAHVLPPRRPQYPRLDHRDDPAVVNRAGDFFQLHGFDAAVDFPRRGERLADHADPPPGRIIEVKPFNRARIPRKQRLYRHQPAHRVFFWFHRKTT